MEKRLHEYHVEQAKEKQELVEKEFLEEITEAERQKIFLRQKDEHFNSWAEKCIKEWDSNVITLKLNLGQKREAIANGIEELSKETLSLFEFP